MKRLASKKLLILFITFLLSNTSAFSQSVVDVINYGINVTDINYTNKTIVANTTVKLTVLSPNISNIELQLLKLTIDSIQENGINRIYNYNDTTIRITPLSILNPGDTVSYTIYYQGPPQQDPSGWGGFYFSGVYAFNLGAGFNSNPHTVGRMWFPCIDEFTDRATFQFKINTSPGYKASCNGILVNETTLTNGNIQWEWQMNQRIPSYLACMAVAPYYTLQRNYNGIPINIQSLPTDTNAVIGTFQHLDSVLSFYIEAYGPYPFDKVGFNLVPFNRGAMEHASSITIGKPFIDGTVNYEDVWIHDLSHMWWGDHVTCASEGDMWLNEGFASFNEYYVTEKLYGKTTYKNKIRSNHRNVLQFAHITDSSYLSLNNVPHNFTYGTTVYDKGADIVHTLRNYMSDSSFFNGAKYYMSNRGDGNATINQLRDDLTYSSGINMNQFFDDWINQPGFPHFSIDSVFIQYHSGPDDYYVYTRQRSKGNSHLYKMPVELTFSDGISDTTFIVMIDSVTNVFKISLLINATYITLDRYEKISDAITDYERKIITTGTLSMPETNVTLSVQSIGIDTSLVRIEHNWVKPDGFKGQNPGIRISDYHYWKVDGIFRNGFWSKATFYYNGSLNTTLGYIDNNLITGVEDSLVFLFRKNTSEEWKLVNGYFLNKAGNATDKSGVIIVDTLQQGEYVLGYRDFTVGLSGIPSEKKSLMTIWPNPSTDSFNIEIFANSSRSYQLAIFDLNGKKIFTKEVSGNEKITWSSKALKGNEYVVRLFDKNMEAESKKIILLK